jgi:hypothetical protein
VTFQLKMQSPILPHGWHLDVVAKATQYPDKLAVHLVDEFKISRHRRASTWGVFLGPQSTRFDQLRHAGADRREKN